MHHSFLFFLTWPTHSVLSIFMSMGNWMVKWHAIFVSNSLSTLVKVRLDMQTANHPSQWVSWKASHACFPLVKAGVHGNERADVLTGSAKIRDTLINTDPGPSCCLCCREWVPPLHGPVKRRANQLLIQTLGIHWDGRCSRDCYGQQLETTKNPYDVFTIN